MNLVDFVSLILKLFPLTQSFFSSPAMRLLGIESLLVLAVVLAVSTHFPSAEACSCFPATPAEKIAAADHLVKVHVSLCATLFWLLWASFGSGSSV